ncbi:MAG: DUF488 domain-containing protein [Syntrophobacteraceae bacterium]
MKTMTFKVIYTVGHSTRSLEEFISLLQANGIELLADVRTVPKSKSNPQFNRDTLPQSLEEAEIEYAYFPELGGWRRSKLEESPNTGWRSPGFKNYADYMLTEKFQAAIDGLVTVALGRRAAVMCAEVLPWRCHRNLISDALTVRGFRVMHIMGKAVVNEHSLTSWAVVSGTSLTYPPQAEHT